MSNEKFNEVQKYYQGLWVVGSPVFLNRSRILNNAAGDIFILNEMINVGKDNITNVILRIVCLKDDKPMAVYESCAYTSINVPRHGVFGGKKLFKILPDTESIEVYVRSVTLADGSVWNNENNHIGVYVEKPEQILESDEYYDFVTGKCNEIGIVPKFWSSVFENGWRCTCSQLNKENDGVCCYCGVSRDWVLSHINKYSIQNMMVGGYEQQENFEDSYEQIVADEYTLNDMEITSGDAPNPDEIQDTNEVYEQTALRGMFDDSSNDSEVGNDASGINESIDEQNDDLTDYSSNANEQMIDNADTILQDNTPNNKDKKPQFEIGKGMVVNELIKRGQEAANARKMEQPKDEVYHALEKEKKRQEEFVSNMDGARKDRYMAQQEAARKYNEEMRQKDRYKKLVIAIIIGGFILCFFVMFLRFRSMNKSNDVEVSSKTTTTMATSTAATTQAPTTEVPTTEVPTTENPTTTEAVTEMVTEKATEKPTEKVTEKVTEKPTEKVTEKVTEKPTEKPTEKVTEKVTEKQTEKVTEKPTEKVTNGGEVVVLLEDINTATKASQILYDAGLIDSVEGFNKYLSDNGLAAKVREGSFTFRKGMTYDEIATIIAR